MPYYDQNGQPTQDTPDYINSLPSVAPKPVGSNQNWLMAGLSSGGRSALSDIGSAYQAVGGAVGWDRLNQGGKQFADQQKALAEADSRPDLEARPWYDPTRIGYKAAQLAPSLAGMIGTGILTEGAGLAPAFLARAGAALPSVLGGGAGLGEEAALTAGKAFAGRMVGATAAGFPLSVGGNVQAAEEGNKGATASQGQDIAALVGGVPEAALGGLGPAGIGQVGGSVARKLLVGGAVGAGVQGAQAGVQQGLTDAFNPELSAADRARNVVSAALGGAAVGAVFGAGMSQFHGQVDKPANEVDLDAATDPKQLNPPTPPGPTDGTATPAADLPPPPISGLLEPPAKPNPFRAYPTEDIQAAIAPLASSPDLTKGQQDLHDALTWELGQRTQPGMEIGQGQLLSVDDVAQRAPQVEAFKQQIFGGLHSNDDFVQNFNATNEPELINSLKQRMEALGDKPEWLTDLATEYGVTPSGNDAEKLMDQYATASTTLKKAEAARDALLNTQDASVLRKANEGVIKARDDVDQVSRLVDLHNQAHDLLHPPEGEMDESGQFNLPGMGVAKRKEVPPGSQETNPGADPNQPDMLSVQEAQRQRQVDVYQQSLVKDNKLPTSGPNRDVINSLNATNEPELIADLHSKLADAEQNNGGRLPGGPKGALAQLADKYGVVSSDPQANQAALEAQRVKLQDKYDSLHDQASAALGSKNLGDRQAAKDIVQKQLPKLKSSIDDVEKLQGLHQAAAELPYGQLDVPGRVHPKRVADWETLERAKQLGPEHADIADKAQALIEQNNRGSAGIATLAKNKISDLMRSKSVTERQPSGIEPNITPEQEKPPAELMPKPKRQSKPAAPRRVEEPQAEQGVVAPAETPPPAVKPPVSKQEAVKAKQKGTKAAKVVPEPAPVTSGNWLKQRAIELNNQMGDMKSLQAMSLGDLHALRDQIEADRTRAQEHVGQNGGVDDAAHPELGRPYSGIIDGAQARVANLIRRKELMGRQSNAVQERSPAQVDVREQPTDGGRVGEGDAQGGQTPGKVEEPVSPQDKVMARQGVKVEKVGRFAVKKLPEPLVEAPKPVAEAPKGRVLDDLSQKEPQGKAAATINAVTDRKATVARLQEMAKSLPEGDFVRSRIEDTLRKDAAGDAHTAKGMIGVYEKVLSDRAKQEAVPPVTKREPEPTQEETPKAAETGEKAVPEWAQTHAKDLGGDVVYHDADKALVRGYSVMGNVVYSGVDRASGMRTTQDVRSSTNKLVTPELKAEAVRQDALEKAKQAAAPNGPFEGATENVVGSKSVDPNIVKYASNLMKVVGLSKVRLFITHADDIKGAGGDAYNLYGDYSGPRATAATSSALGDARQIGPGLKDTHIQLNPDLKPEMVAEVLSHEIGHIIERVAYRNAPESVKSVIKAAYDRFYKETSGEQPAENIINATRNRYTAELTLANADGSKPLSGRDDTYFRGFGEWFADQVSRWATTADKPRNALEKFFAGIGQKLRDLWTAVTGKKAEFAPTQEMRDYLDRMGPNSDAGFLADRGAKIPTDGESQQSRATLDQTPEEAETTVKDVIGHAQELGTRLQRGLYDKAVNYSGAIRRTIYGFMNGQGLEQEGERLGMQSPEKHFAAVNTRAQIEEASNKVHLRALEPFNALKDLKVKETIQHVLAAMQPLEGMEPAARVKAMNALRGDLDRIQRAGGMAPMKSMLQGAQTGRYMELAAHLQERIENWTKQGIDLGLGGENIFKQFQHMSSLHDNPAATNQIFRQALSTMMDAINRHIAEKQGAALEAGDRAYDDALARGEKVGDLRGIRDAERRANLAPYLSDMKMVRRYVKAGLKQADTGTYMPMGRDGKFFAAGRLATDDRGNVLPGAVEGLQAILKARGFDNIGFHGDGVENSTFMARVKEEGQKERLRSALLEAQKAGHLDPNFDVTAGYPEQLNLHKNLGTGYLQQMAEQVNSIIKSAPEAMSPANAAHFRRATYMQWLDTLPDHSLLKSLRPRTFAHGFDTEMNEALARRLKVSARSSAGLAMSNEIASSMEAMRQEVQEGKSTPNGTKMQELAKEIVTRETQKDWDVPHTIFDALQSMAHSIVIGANPAYWVTLASQVATLSHPELAKTHGFGQAGVHIGAVTGDAFNVLNAIFKNSKATVALREEALKGVKGMTKDKMDFLMHLDNNGVLTGNGFTRDMSNQGVEASSNAHKFHSWANAMGSYAELMPRVITALAAKRAYEAKPVKGMTREEFAAKVVRESQFDWGQGQSARLTGKRGLAGPAGKLVFGFMQYQTHMLEKLYTETHNLIAPKDGSPEARRQAGVWLASHLGATTLLAGTLGLPFAGVLTGLGTKLSVALTGNSDYDLEGQYRTWLGHVFGSAAGDAIASGLPRTLGVDLSGKVGEEHLLPFTRMIQDRRKFEDAEKDYFKSMAGSAVGELGNMYLGGRDMINGDYLQGLIKVLPEGFKGLAEAGQAAKYGYVDKYGVKQRVQPTGADIAKIAIGLDPTDKARLDEAQGIKAGVLADRQYQSQNISRHLVQAVNQGNMNDERYWITQAQEYAQMHPGLGNPLMSFNRDLTSHATQGAMSNALGVPMGVKPLDLGLRSTLGFAAGR